ncbi:protein GLUTAMINE DUMPER 4-like [Abrus precatorius]|uniref:Protein GLUTAMINE DUMPER 4-like n=1 Tax=Abrus precatorius TaxID=3816 RepID=A0A8B8JNU7_ABRPR|nr:protein GLUTAMINE DUMPER 4-like [Abrus precatorius]
MRSITPTKLNTATITTTNTLAPTATTSSPSTISSHHSPWHSPIPYLFGGLATIMGLIAFALLMLACSYWTLTRSLDTNLENNNNKEGGDHRKKVPIKDYEDKILVIMAGDQKPTFLATPVYPNSSSFAHSVSTNHHKDLGNSQDCDKSQKEIVDNHVNSAVTQENASSQHQQHSQLSEIL